MKRMFVSPELHGHGMGRALANRLIAEGAASGYQGMRLDTTASQKAAIALYESLGFRPSPAYYDIPDEFADWLIFYELRFPTAVLAAQSTNEV